MARTGHTSSSKDPAPAVTPASAPVPVPAPAPAQAPAPLASNNTLPKETMCDACLVLKPPPTPGTTKLHTKKCKNGTFIINS